MMSKKAVEVPHDSKVDPERATEEFKRIIREDIEEHRKLIEKLRRKLN